MILPDRAYAFFSHTHKAQKENMPLLDKVHLIIHIFVDGDKLMLLTFACSDFSMLSRSWLRGCLCMTTKSLSGTMGKGYLLLGNTLAEQDLLISCMG